MTPRELEEGYWRSYGDFYSYRSILQRSVGLPNPAKRFLYNVGWRKLDRLWNFVIEHDLIEYVLPVFEFILATATHREDTLAAVPLPESPPQQPRA